MLERFCGTASETGESKTWGTDKQAVLREAVSIANRRVFTQAETNSRLHGMGTTLVALLVDETQALVAHVGDSRCYIWKNGTLRQWTQDHSLVDEQVRLGQLTREEAERSPLRNVITRAVGSQSSVLAELDEEEVEPGEIFLLCSDGLTREVTDAQIATILSGENDLEAGCRKLIDGANANGGRDNITCLLVRAR
jgi:protein phosphatase